MTVSDLGALTPFIVLVLSLSNPPPALLNKFSNEYFDPNFPAAGARGGSESAPCTAERGLLGGIAQEGVYMDEGKGSSAPL